LKNSLAFDEIVENTKKVVLSAVYKNLHEENHEFIDDVVQETYIRAYKALVSNKFKEESKLTTWLYTIARNEAIRCNEKQFREKEKARKWQKQMPESYTEDFEKETSERPVGWYLNWIQKIPRIYGIVIEKYLAGKSEQEISQELGIQKGTVKSRASRGREMLKNIIQKEDDL
jgi:RNA polymerase sigma-70 factor (ECF subfamily)